MFWYTEINRMSYYLPSRQLGYYFQTYNMVLYTGNKLIEVNITADIYVCLYQHGCMYVYIMQQWSLNIIASVST